MTTEQPAKLITSWDVMDRFYWWRYPATNAWQLGSRISGQHIAINEDEVTKYAEAGRIYAFAAQQVMAPKSPLMIPLEAIPESYGPRTWEVWYRQFLEAWRGGDYELHPSGAGWVCNFPMERTLNIVANCGVKVETAATPIGSALVAFRCTDAVRLAWETNKKQEQN